MANGQDTSRRLNAALLRTLPLTVVCWAAALGSIHATALRPEGLRCDYAVDPVGVEFACPSLSWRFPTRGHNQRQSAYRVLVASSPQRLEERRADLWDSGVVSSSNSVHVPYGGRPLGSRQEVYWKVQVWDAGSHPSGWSPVARWTMGLLRPADWQARWIGSGPASEPRPPAGFFQKTNELAGLDPGFEPDGRSTLLRKSFTVGKRLRRAQAFVTGVGYYELYCNGQRVGDQVLAPAKANYRQWIQYDIHNLAPLLKPGANAIGVMLGNGWFNPYRKWWDPYRMLWFGSKRALVQLHLDYEDGSSEVVVSDGSWRTAPGPVLFSCVYDGEVYDATQEVPGWDCPGFVDSAWKRAREVEPPGGALVARRMPPIRITDRRRPVALTQPKPGVWIFDLGQNAAGWVRLSVTGPRGTRITLRYAEDLHPDGTLDPTSNERALATDAYVLKGEGREQYAPRFTFHGFRYVEVTGFPGTPTRDSVLGCVVHTACEPAGAFECSDDRINGIHRATVWAQRSNLMGYPMDCPQRDERLGWMGDALVTAEEAMFNFDAPLFFRQWLEGLRFNQNPANGDLSIISPRPYLNYEPDPTWSSACLIMGWQYYRHYGDRAFLAAHYETMKRFVDFLGTQATHHILPKYWIGDWGTIAEGWQEGDPPSVATAFYFLDATLLARAAEVLDRPADAARYATLAGEIRAAYNHRFYNPTRHQYDQGSQFSNAFPLYLGLAPATDSPAVLQNILDDLGRRDGHFTVGVLGAKYLIDALTSHDRPDVAFQLAARRGYPSWAHMLEGGRTTLSEFWDLKGSHNHVMMGSIDAWFYSTLAGIQPDDDRPGFEQVLIRPFLPDALDWVRARVDTVRGPVSVSWKKRDHALFLEVHIPANTRGSIRVPAGDPRRVSSHPTLTPARLEPAAAVYEVGSGGYEFTVPAP